ncbi:MAG: uridine kinase [Anaerolineales bacterium]|nr:uridine kinase [Chloroflexota bacterium]MBL6980152.1 uridine kinase [Anaerolineales bacterium]
MLGDVLLIEEKHKKAAEAIVERVNAMSGDKIVIAVGGESGSGKTELGHEIARLLKFQGTPAKVMHIDNYYNTSPQDRNPWRQEHGVESIGYTEYDWDSINQNLGEFKADADNVIMPCIDLLTDQEDRLKTSFKGLRYMVVEGLYAVQAEADLRVFIDLTYHETKKAQLLRGKENVDEWRMQVLQREHEVVRSLRPLADLIIDKDYQVKEAKLLGEV